MPLVKDIHPFINTICSEIKTITGVDRVYLYGSYADHENEPNYVVKDIDIIAATQFDSGDLLAIDNSKYSALRIHPSELEDEGFNPQAVIFTKRFLAYEKYNVDHWASSSDGKLLHWGAIPDSQEEWADLHIKAEKDATEETGIKRANLAKESDNNRIAWKKSYESCLKKFISKASGWYASENSAIEILSKAKLVN